MAPLPVDQKNLLKSAIPAIFRAILCAEIVFPLRSSDWPSILLPQYHMKTGIPLLILIGLAQSALAVTHAVLSGEAIQPKIDAAAPGDIIAIFGGTYPGDVTVDKAIRLVEVDGQDVTITGNVTWNNVTNAPPFEGFTVGSSGKGITINNTTGLVIKNVDARPGFGIRSFGNSQADVIGGNSSAVSQDGGSLALNQANISSGVDSTANSLKTLILRCAISGDVALRSNTCWFGYSSSQKFGFFGSNARIVVVKSNFNALGRAVDGIGIYGSNNQCLIVNNFVQNITHGIRILNLPAQGYPRENYPGKGISVTGAQTSAMIQNNYVKMNWTGYYDEENNAGEGLGVTSVTNVKVVNNIVWGARYGVKASFGVDARNNHYYGLIAGNETGGVVAIASSTGDPIFVSGQTPLLQPSSPCVNAGVNDPIFNDIDGSRNDIGPSGGCLFDPDGWTTNKPVVISFDIAPQQLLRGVDTQVTISNGQAVAQP